ncbi:MAG: nucleotide-binding protein [Polyangiaceae bacterium]|nr:nucleotide-binding protein [Polyangiaceae bacterium]
MRALLVMAGLFMAVGCKDNSREVVPVKTEPPAPAAAAGPLTPGADGTLQGKVAERMDASGYTYLRVARGAADAWVAVPENTVAVGTDVTVLDAQAMPGFESKTLKRKFDMIYFGSGLKGVSGAAAAPKSPAGHAGASGPAPGASVDLSNIQVDKATGADAKTIAELWAQKADLKDKTVSVRGKVVKATAGVMGKNWLHLRDGSGSEDKKDNDITVTTDDMAAANDVVTVQGVVHLDKDLGSGYQYPVLIEDAKVTK